MEDNCTKSKTISEQLRREILGGKFDVTRKLPSEHQLMRRFSVARETVRSALKDLLDKKLVERRPGYGTFLADLAETKAAQMLQLIDELKEHVNRPLPEMVYNEIFDNVRDEICRIMKG